MNQIFIEGVRCFPNRLSVSLKPITLLIGENSTGKSTFLAMARIAWDICHKPSLIDFNEEPFLLGAYHQIASYRGGRSGWAKHFVIGAQVSIPSHLKGASPNKLGDTAFFLGYFANREGQPKIEKWVLDISPFRIEIAVSKEKEPPQITITAPSGTTEVNDIFFKEFPNDIVTFLSYLSLPLEESEDRTLTSSEIYFLQNLRFLLDIGPRPYAFAPIRTRPQKTYDLLRDVPMPEGSHVPMILAKSYSSDSAAWDRLRKSLDSFGKASGLFSDVEVRRLGREKSAPFQIRVKVSGPAFNLVDVGYGVSQILPIIVDVLREKKGSTFLLQQPEVHLHPKAQAELGSFLTLLAKRQKKRFLIETHSDYLVDRIRMDVRDKEHDLTPEDVAILYFERKNGSAKIHHLQIDESGNLKGAPSSYRRFFLDEEKRLLVGE